MKFLLGGNVDIGVLLFDRNLWEVRGEQGLLLPLEIICWGLNTRSLTL